jgi:acyl-CoA synthetase (AMP-forming)/AMP-acid ligase II
MLSLGEIVRLNGKRVGNQIAIVWNNVRETHRELDARTNSLASALLSMGIAKGDRVALLASNCHQFIEVHVAASKIGAILVPLNGMLSPGEIGGLIRHSESKVLFITGNFKGAVDRIRSDVPSVKEVISIDGGEGFTDYETMITGQPANDPLVPFGEDETAYITYTSGTTGLPKGVMLSNRNLFSNSLNAIASCLIPLGGVEVVAFPLFFSAIFNSHVIPYFLAEGGVVILDRFRPELLIDAINKEHPQYTTLNPTMLYDLITHPDFKDCDMSSMKGILVAAAPISLERIEMAMKATNNILVQGYGQTECTSFATCTRSSDYAVNDPVKKARRFTTIGHPCPTLDVRVFNDKGEEVAPDGAEVGEIVIRGPSVMQGYWKQPEITAATIKDGWLYTGDLGTIDEEGFLWYVGRKKDMINSGGLKIYPEEVENLLYTNEKVKEVAIVGRPDERWGETVTAVVVPKPGQTLTEEEVIRFCRERLASYKKPTKVYVMDKLPRNASGKIKKNDLRDMIARGELK